MDVPAVKEEDECESMSHHIPHGGGDGTNVEMNTTAEVATTAPASQVMISPDDFAEDLELRLGRANGNVYHRKPGVDGVHDGQIMIRLKKKRFIVIDYGIIPSHEDIRMAACYPQMATPPGCGKQKCVTAECTKIGVPVLLHDSDPNEPASLYMRSGLCFTCQRLLNEKRRTQRKRKSDLNQPVGVVIPAVMAGGTVGAFNISPAVATTAVAANGTYHLQPTLKRFKVNGECVDLPPDAIIINGPIEGTKRHGNGYTFNEIGVDLQNLMHGTTNDIHQLVNDVGSATAIINVPAPAAPTTIQSSQPIAGDSEGNGSADAFTAATAAAAAAAVAAVNVANVTNASTAAVNDETVSAAKAAVDAANGVAVTELLESNQKVSPLYEKIFLSLSKSIYLLSQWKSSWDEMHAVALTKQHLRSPQAVVASGYHPQIATTTNESTNAANTISDQVVADAVANAMTVSHEHAANAAAAAAAVANVPNMTVSAGNEQSAATAAAVAAAPIGNVPLTSCRPLASNMLGDVPMATAPGVPVSATTTAPSIDILPETIPALPNPEMSVAPPSASATPRVVTDGSSSAPETASSEGNVLSANALVATVLGANIPQETASVLVDSSVTNGVVESNAADNDDSSTFQEQQQPMSKMMPLLLAADAKEEDGNGSKHTVEKDSSALESETIGVKVEDNQNALSHEEGPILFGV